MRLSEPDYRQFLRVHHALLLYYGQRQAVVPDSTTLDAFLANDDYKQKIECRKALLDHLNRLDGFRGTGHFFTASKQHST